MYTNIVGYINISQFNKELRHISSQKLKVEVRILKKTIKHV